MNCIISALSAVIRGYTSATLYPRDKDARELTDAVGAVIVLVLVLVLAHPRTLRAVRLCVPHALSRGR